MAVTFDASRIAAFQNAQFASDKSIAALDTDGSLKANGTYRGALGAIFRSSADKASNNAVRTELLRSLGQAFGIGGMTETNGKVTFSKGFMDELEKILGKDVFKRGDFKIGADGTVTSGRPLTSRRISAIIAKATTAAQGASGEPEMGTLGPIMEPDVPEVETVKTVTTTKAGPTGPKAATDGQEVETVRTVTTTKAESVDTTSAVSGSGEFDTKAYLAKLDVLQKEIASLKEKPPAISLFADPDAAESGVRGADKFKFQFNQVRQCLEFLDRDFEGLIAENDEWISNERSGKSNEGVARFVIRDPKTHEDIPLHFGKNLRGWLTQNTSFGGLYHTEQNGFPDSQRLDGPNDGRNLMNYVRRTTVLYVRNAIDLYFDAKASGKLNAYIEAVGVCNSGCIDGSASDLIEMRETLGLMDKELGGEDKNKTIAKCIFDEIENAIEKNPDAKGWGDVAKSVKEALVGKVRQIGTVNSQCDFVPLMENGEPVVRAITEKDIDDLGPACAKFIFLDDGD